MDLNKIYPLLSDEYQNQIKKIVASYLGELASGLGYQVTEKVISPPVTIPAPPPLEAPRRKYLKFPIKLHGLNIPSKERLVELYKDARGKTKTWNGELNWSKIQYQRVQHHKTFEEIFPYPPPESARQTLIKRTDNEGNSYTPL